MLRRFAPRLVSKYNLYSLNKASIIFHELRLKYVMLNNELTKKAFCVISATMTFLEQMK